VTSPSGAGPAAARNAGARATAADVVMFVDSDVVVHEDAFTRVRKALADDPRLVAVFGSYDDRIVTVGTVAAFRNLLHHVVHQRSAGDSQSFWAGIGAVRRSAFDAAEGFDEKRYPRPSIEDIELGLRLARQGPIVLDPHLQGTHLKEWSLGSMVHTDFAGRGVPWVQLLVEQRHLPRSLNLGPRERVSALAALALAWGLVGRRRNLALAAAALEVALNRDLLALLYARRGPRGAVAGVALHTLHQLTAAAAVPAGVLATLRAR
jgi:glycosyltransferase involved in cell wall biosynthesis